MEALQKSYMLLPNFTFQPGKEIKLGILLPLNKSTKLPDPESPLNPECCLPVAAPIITKVVEKDWSFDSTNSIEGFGGVWADAPILTSLGGGLNVGRGGNEGLQIECETLTIERFSPSPSFIAQSVNDEFVQRYMRNHWRPSVYLITGLMIASKTSIGVGTGRTRDLQAKLAVDATGMGVPVKVGPEGGYRTASNRNLLFKADGPFVLAYRLRRIRRKISGQYADRDYNKWALFDDQDRWEGSSALDELEIEDMQPGSMQDI